MKPNELLAVRKAGGGHQLAMKVLLRVPEPWRPLLMIAAAADEVFFRRRRPRPQTEKKRSSAPRSQQLELFA